MAAIGHRKDQTLVRAVNGSPWNNIVKESHAECRLAKKLDVGSVVYVARIKIGTGEFGLAKPCSNCERVLKAKGVKKVYYTITSKEFGILYL